MDADRLVQQALECMDRGDSERAKALLKKAAAEAPLRTDIRDLLVQAIARQQEAAPRKKSSPGKSSPAGKSSSGRGSSFWFWMTVGSFLLLLVLGGVGAVGYYLVSRPLQDEGGSGEASPGAGVIKDVGGETPGVKTDDPDAEARERLRKEAVEAADKGNYQDAIRIMGVLLQKNPPNPIIYQKVLAKWHFELGKQEYQKDRYAAAIENFSRATRADGDNTDYYFWLGYVHFLKGRKDTGSQKQQELQAAEQALVKATRLDPDNLKAYDTLAKTYIALGRKVPDGVNCYREIIRRAPGSPEATQAQKDLSDMGIR